jgi:hypothetical protein
MLSLFNLEPVRVNLHSCYVTGNWILYLNPIHFPTIIPVTSMCGTGATILRIVTRLLQLPRSPPVEWLIQHELHFEEAGAPLQVAFI